MKTGLSHDIGVTQPPLLEHTIGVALDLAAETWPDALALVSRHQGIRWTWRELKDQVDAVACGLAARGLRCGDRVGIWAPNCAEWTVIQLATAKAGLILVTHEHPDHLGALAAHGGAALAQAAAASLWFTQE